jgi:hypothetical protein
VLTFTAFQAGYVLATAFSNLGFLQKDTAIAHEEKQEQEIGQETEDGTTSN